jgi:nucleoside-diphosphate-sugar epimerase
MRVFVAGGTGALGLRVVALLVEAGHQATATARSGPGAEALRARGGRPLDVDLYRREAIREAIAGHEAVLRLTTKIPPLNRMRSAASWAETGRLRNHSARLIVEACRDEGIPIYLHESVAFVYADGGERWLDEESPVDVVRAAPLHDALRGEEQAGRFTAYGGRGIVLRFGGFYAADSEQSLNMAASARRGRLALLGPSRNYYPSVHLDDAAAATVAALGAAAGAYNVVDEDPISLGEYLSCLAAAAGAKPLRRVPSLLGPIALGTTWQYLSRSMRVSSKRLRDATGWKPSVPDAREGWRRIGEEWARSGVTDLKGSPA